MEKEKKLSVGELAKITGVTVRTLQYYDNIKLLPTSGWTTGGRRYYTKSDVFRLQQIIFYKSLGFSLSEIKDRIVDAVTQQEIEEILEGQQDILFQQIEAFNMSKAMVDACLTSLRAGNYPSWEHLIGFMTSLKRNNVNDWQHFDYDDKSKSVLESRYTQEEAVQIYRIWKTLILEAVGLVIGGTPPSDDAAQSFAFKWLEMVERTTQGDTEQIEAHKSVYEQREEWPEDDKRLMEIADDFIDKAVNIYLAGGSDEQQGGLSDDQSGTINKKI